MKERDRERKIFAYIAVSNSILPIFSVFIRERGTRGTVILLLKTINIEKQFPL